MQEDSHQEKYFESIAVWQKIYIKIISDCLLHLIFWIWYWFLSSAFNMKKNI